MSVLLETTLGDLVVDLDIEGSPELCRNFLKLCKARYYTSTLVYNVEPTRYCQLGDPQGNGKGGACVFGLIEENDSKKLLKSKHRFMKSKGRILSRNEKQEKGRVVAVEMNGIPDTIGSQFLITLDQGEDKALDGIMMQEQSGGAVHPAQFLSLGTVVEDDDNVLSKIQSSYCDADGRPYADIRVIRALVIHDPFEDPDGMDELLKRRGVVVEDSGKVMDSPNYERPPEEVVEHRIQALQMEENEEETLERARAREEEIQQRETKSRAVVLEMLGDLPSADIKAPENVLFVCKLNSVTEDDDLELIFSRFDSNCKAEIIRDPLSGDSLQYAFVEFSTKQQCVEAYFKMNNALIDDRRIKVDFSQSVAKVWDRYHQKARRMPRNVTIDSNNRGGGGGGRQGRGGGGGGGRGDGGRGGHGGRHAGHPPSSREGYREAHREARHQRRTRPHDKPHGDGRNGSSRWGPPRTSQEQRRGRGDGGSGRDHHQHDGNHSHRDEYGRVIPDNVAGRRSDRGDSGGGGRGRYGDDGHHRRGHHHHHHDDDRHHRQYDRHENRKHDSDEGDYKQRRDLDHNDRGGSRERSSRDHPRRSRTSSDNRQRGRRSRSYSSDSSADSGRRRSDGGGSASSVSDDASRKRKKHGRHHRRKSHKRSRKHRGRRHDDDDSDSDGSGRDRHQHHRRHKKKRHRKEHKRRRRSDDHDDREHKRRKHHKSSRSRSPPSQDQQE